MFLLAALVQLGLGLTIIMRRPRVEWAVVLGALFCLNGALSLNALFVHAGVYLGGAPGDGFRHPGSRIFFVFDRLTNLGIAYLALAYPRRPAWAVRRPWLLPSLFVVVAATVLVPFYMGVQYLSPVEVETCKELCNAPTLFSAWTQGVLSLGLPLLLLRWAANFPTSSSPLEIEHLKILLAAFATRVVHVEIRFQTSSFLDILHDPALALSASGLAGLAFLRGVVSAAAILTAVALLLRARRMGTSQVAHAAGFVLAFVLVGVAEAVLSLTVDIVRGELPYFYGLLLQLDLVLLRPALVAYGMVRYYLFGPFFLGPSARVGVLGGLSWAISFMALLTLLTLAGASVVAAYVSSAAVAAVLCAAAVVALRPFATHLKAPGSASNAAAIAYVAALEETYRNKRPSPQNLEALARQRRLLGIPEEQAATIEAAVQSQWTGTVGSLGWKPGETLAGRYRIESFLGEGSSAETYLATDLLQARPVVLKHTRRVVDGESRRALVREAFHLQRLDHPNIVRLLCTEQAGGEPVLVLEYLVGGSLAERLADGALDGVRAMRLARDLLAGLQAAHTAGILHRDLKPSNILFTEDGRAKLADFGIARSRGVGADLVEHTATGDPGRGSLRYTSPEQVRGLPADERSDLFSLGMLLAEAAGGKPLPTQPATDREVRFAILKGPPPLLGPGVPRRLGDAIRAATRRLPDLRPPSAARMAGILDGQRFSR